MTEDVKKEAIIEQINLKVAGSDGNEVFFKVKKTTPFSKIFQAYADRVGKTENALRFMFDGQRITREQTPQDLEMEDDDKIDAQIEQVGGDLA